MVLLEFSMSPLGKGESVKKRLSLIGHHRQERCRLSPQSHGHGLRRRVGRRHGRRPPMLRTHEQRLQPCLLHNQDRLSQGTQGKISGENGERGEAAEAEIEDVIPIAN